MSQANGQDRTVPQILMAIESRLAALEARAAELGERQKSEIVALFDRTKESNARLSLIERTYWPKLDQERFEREIRDALRELHAGIARGSEQTGRLGVKIAWASGAIAILMLLAQILGPRWLDAAGARELARPQGLAAEVRP